MRVNKKFNKISGVDKYSPTDLQLLMSLSKT